MGATACGGIATGKDHGGDDSSNLNGEVTAPAARDHSHSVAGTGGTATTGLGDGDGYLGCGGPPGGYGGTSGSYGDFGGVASAGSYGDFGGIANGGAVGLPNQGGGVCYVTGEWHTHSAPWNGLSTDATIVLDQDGTLHGTPEFSGKWSLEGRTLSIFATVGQDMTCEYPDTWTLTFSDDCNTAPLVPIGSGCTGARRYLDWNVTLTRF